jgi:large subunit ribosomal protein L17
VPKPRKGPRLGSGPAHQKLILSGLTTSLIRDGKVRTTEARAKAVRPLAERMITFAKRGDLASRRTVLRTVRDREIVHKLFAEIAPQYADRSGGYTRIVKIGPRKGDAAPMALIELVGLTGDEE